MGRDLVMWAIVIITIPVSSSGNKSPSPTVMKSEALSTITQESFMTLLTGEDVRGVLATNVPLTTRFYDYKEMAGSIDPSQVSNMDSFYGLSFQTENGNKGMTFSAVDLDSEASAQGRFEKVKSGTPGMQDMAPPLGDSSARVEVNALGTGSVLVFIKGDKVILLHTSQPDSEQPLISLESLGELAEIVANKL